MFRTTKLLLVNLQIKWLSPKYDSLYQIRALKKNKFSWFISFFLFESFEGTSFGFTCSFMAITKRKFQLLSLFCFYLFIFLIILKKGRRKTTTDFING